MESADRREAFATTVDRDLDRAEQRVRGYRRNNSLLIIGGLIASTLAAVLAGGMAAGGPEIANTIGGWRIGCTAVAFLAGTATIVTGLHDRLKIGEHLANATACASQLGALRFSLRVQNADLDSCETYYRQTLEKYRYDTV
jgi:hypothetical protein